MNFKTTAVLIVLLAALGGFVFLMKDRSPSYSDLEAQRLAAAQGAALFDADDFKAAWVDTVELTHNNTSARMSLKNGEWRQVMPVDFSLSAGDLQNVIETVAGLKYTDLFNPGQGDYPALDKLGLAPSTTQITVSSSGEHVFSHTVSLGRTIVGGKLYVMRDDDPKVYVVADDLAKQLADEPVHRWRIKSLASPSESQVSQITMVNRDPNATAQTIELHKKEGKWTMSSPDAGRVDRQAVASLLNAMQTTRINSFVADAPADLASYGLDTPAVEVAIASRPTRQLSPEEQKILDLARRRPDPLVTHTLKLGAPADLQKATYYATWTNAGLDIKPAVFTVDKEVFERFTRSVDTLRDPALTPLAQGEIKQISLEHSGSLTAFSRSAKGWEYDALPDGRTSPYAADDGVVSQLVASIAAARATRFVPAEKDTPSPLVTLTLTGLGQATPDTLRLWAVNEKDENGKAQWLVRRNDEPVSRVVLADSLKMALAPAWQFRDRELADLPADKINRIVIIQPDGRKVELTRTLPTAISETTVQIPAADQKPRDAAGPWKLADAPDEMVDPTLPAAIVSGMSPMRVAAWQPPDASLQIKQGTQGYDLTVSTSDGQTVHLKMNEQGQAQMDGQSQTFTLSDVVRDAIKASYGKSEDASEAALNMTK